MRLVWDEAKRQKTIQERGLDFADCIKVFSGPVFEFPDERKKYPEMRKICVGFLDFRMVIVVYSDGKSDRRIISMRKANEREVRKFQETLG